MQRGGIWPGDRRRVTPAASRPCPGNRGRAVPSTNPLTASGIFRGVSVPRGTRGRSSRGRGDEIQVVLRRGRLEPETHVGLVAGDHHGDRGVRDLLGVVATDARAIDASRESRNSSSARVPEPRWRLIMRTLPACEVAHAPMSFGLPGRTMKPWGRVAKRMRRKSSRGSLAVCGAPSARPARPRGTWKPASVAFAAAQGGERVEAALVLHVQARPRRRGGGARSRSRGSRASRGSSDPAARRLSAARTPRRGSPARAPGARGRQPRPGRSAPSAVSQVPRPLRIETSGLPKNACHCSIRFQAWR